VPLENIPNGCLSFGRENVVRIEIIGLGLVLYFFSLFRLFISASGGNLLQYGD
jgi:hypothetical protein